MKITVNGVEIDTSNVDKLVKDRLEHYDQVLDGDQIPDTAELREWVMEDLIEAELFRQEAVKTQPLPNERQLQQELEYDRYAACDAEERVAKAREALQIRSLQKKIKRQVPKITDAERDEMLDNFKNRLVSQESYKVRIICAKCASVENADNFIALAELKANLESEKASEWQATFQSDYLYRDIPHTLTISKGEFPEELENKVTNLKPDEISDVVTLPNGDMCILKFLGWQTTSDRITDEEAMAFIEKAYFGDAYLDKYLDFVEALKQNADICKTASTATDTSV